jgi:hypothetical protein
MSENIEVEVEVEGKDEYLYIDFESLKLNINLLSLKKHPIALQKKVFEYLKSLDETDRKGYEIAFNHLGTSFDIARSNGFKHWLSSK